MSSSSPTCARNTLFHVVTRLNLVIELSPLLVYYPEFDDYLSFVQEVGGLCTEINLLSPSELLDVNNLLQLWIFLGSEFPILLQFITETQGYFSKNLDTQPIEKPLANDIPKDLLDLIKHKWIPILSGVEKYVSIALSNRWAYPLYSRYIDLC
jgi:hypothetical protein